MTAAEPVPFREAVAAMSGASVRPELAHLSASPLDLLRHIYVDSIVHGPQELQYLIDRLGAERIVLGSGPS